MRVINNPDGSVTTVQMVGGQEVATTHSAEEWAAGPAVVVPQAGDGSGTSSGSEPSPAPKPTKKAPGKKK